MKMWNLICFEVFFFLSFLYLYSILLENVNLICFGFFSPFFIGLINHIKKMIDKVVEFYMFWTFFSLFFIYIT